MTEALRAELGDVPHRADDSVDDRAALLPDHGLPAHLFASFSVLCGAW